MLIQLLIQTDTVKYREYREYRQEYRTPRGANTGRNTGIQIALWSKETFQNGFHDRAGP
mgnify:CR=1 FL=1